MSVFFFTEGPLSVILRLAFGIQKKMPVLEYQKASHVQYDFFLDGGGDLVVIFKTLPLVVQTKLSFL